MQDPEMLYAVRQNNSVLNAAAVQLKNLNRKIAELTTEIGVGPLSVKALRVFVLDPVLSSASPEESG